MMSVIASKRQVDVVGGDGRGVVDGVGEKDAAFARAGTVAFQDNRILFVIIDFRSRVVNVAAVDLIKKSNVSAAGNVKSQHRVGNVRVHENRVVDPVAVGYRIVAGKLNVFTLAGQRQVVGSVNGAAESHAFSFRVVADKAAADDTDGCQIVFVIAVAVDCAAVSVSVGV